MGDKLEIGVGDLVGVFIGIFILSSALTASIMPKFVNPGITLLFPVCSISPLSWIFVRVGF